MANNRIKGLTVEIGGDTTQLGKALESVNKKSNDLSSELGEINRLLKFDPENTDLLAQRQKVLADTIENTEKKLETLREAERQVQRQFERGEVSEEQVRALQREIIATEGKLKSYRKQADGAADDTKDLGDKADNTGGAFEGMGGKLANAAKVGIGAVVAGAGAAIGALVASAEATREYRTEMGKLTTAFETVGHRTEIAEESYKRLQAVIGETDQSVEAAQQIALLAESEEDVIQWSDLAAGVVARFGDALQPEAFFEAANETIKLGEATGAYVQLLEGAGYDVDKFNAGLAACTTESEKQAYMLKITDELLGDAADMYRVTNEEVMRANSANEAWTATMAQAGAAVEPILTDVKLLGASLLGELMPGITEVTDAFRGLINGEEGSAEKVGEALSGLLTQIIDKVVEMLPTLVEAAVSLLTQIIDKVVEMLPTLVEAAVSLLSSLITTIVNMVPQLLETIAVVLIQLVDGVNALIPVLAQAIVDMIPKLVETLVSNIPVLIDGAVQFLLAIVDAIALIIPPLLEALPDVVLALIDGLLGAIPDLIEGALQFLMAIVQAIPPLLDALLPEIPTIVDTVIDGLLDNIPLLVDAAIELFFAIMEAIPEIAAELYEEMPSIVASIVDGLLEALPALWDAGVQLLEGLIDGMLDFDIKGALSKVGDGIINGFKKVFDIHSPSRVMMGIGELLDEGLAEGITDGARAPVNALDKLSDDMLDSVGAMNGVTVERRVAHAYSSTPTTADGISSKLDQIYKAILSGQVIMLDGKTLVGSTAVRYDNELGQRRVLAERGAL